MPNIAKIIKNITVNVFNFALAVSTASRICERTRADWLNELTAEFRGLQNLSDDVFQFTGN